MMAGDAVEFRKDLPLREMEGRSPKDWALEWAERIDEHYFVAADLLNEKRLGFASLTLQCSAIEAIGTVVLPPPKAVKTRFKETAKILFGYADVDSDLFFLHYRCGLVHNGRTNQSGRARRPNELSAISYDSADEFYARKAKDGARLIVINPTGLAKTLRIGFERWFNDQDLNDLGGLIAAEYTQDIQLVKRMDKL